MYRKLLKVDDSFALYEVTEELYLDEAGIFETSYDYNKIIEVRELFGNKVLVKYTTLQPVLPKFLEDRLLIGVDISAADVPTIIVHREMNDKLYAVNTLTGSDAVEVYSKLLGVKYE